MSNIHNRLKLGLKKVKQPLIRGKTKLQMLDYENIENNLKACSKTEHVLTVKEENITKPVAAFVQETQQHAELVAELKKNLDEAQTSLESKRKDNETLSKQNKRLELILLNFNQEYYEREFLRLKADGEQYQLQNEESKHRVYIVENQKKELAAALSSKNEQLKVCSKELEKEKLVAAELKHQIAEKQSMYKRIIQGLEKANNIIMINSDDLSRKYNKLEFASKQKTVDSETFSVQVEVLSKRWRQSEEKFIVMKKNSDRQIFEKIQKINQLENQIKLQKKEFEQTLQKYMNQIEHLKSQRKNDTLIIEKKVFSMKTNNDVINLEMAMKKLTEERKELAFELQEKNKIVEGIERKLISFYSPEQFNEVENKYLQAEERRNNTIQTYEEKLLALFKENEKLKTELIATNSCPFPLAQSKSTNAYDFNEVLRKNIEDNQKLKRELIAKSDQINSLREQATDLKLKHKQFENQIQILNKKVKSAEKNYKIEHEVEQQMLKNDSDSLRRKLSTVETLLECKVRQNKQKDKFIQTSIIGRSRAEDVPLIMADLERIFLTFEKHGLPS